MTKIFSLAFIALILCIGCTKQDAQDSSAVFVRIKNSTGQSFGNGQVATTDYGFIQANSTTEFKKITGPIYSIGCMLNTEGTPIYAGVGICGTPMPPPISSGYYTLEILPMTAEGYYPTNVSTE